MPPVKRRAPAKTAAKPPATPSSVLDAVQTGDRIKSLEALRDDLAAGIDALTVRQLIHLAPLAKQLAAVMAELAELAPPKQEADVVDELLAKRENAAARRARQAAAESI